MKLVVICSHCKIPQPEFEVRNEDFQAWRDGVLIQNAMPYLTSNQRELLISETCPACWDELFPPTQLSSWDLN